MKGNDIDAIVTDIKRLKTSFNNTKSFDAIISYLENNYLDKNDNRKRLSTTVSSMVNGSDRSANVMQAIVGGMNEKTIIRDDFYRSPKVIKHNVTPTRLEGDTCVKVINSVTQGMNEKTIIKEIRDHYDTIHPTQKPVRLLERLLQLTCCPGDIVVDPFSGSGSSGIAAANLNMFFTGFELDKEYYDLSIERVKKLF